MDTSPVKQRAHRYIGVYLTIIVFIVAFGFGIFVGQGWAIKKQISNADGNVEISKVLDLNRKLNKSDSVEFEQFWDVWDRVKEKYVKQPVKDVDLFYGAIQGLVMSLDDPYSVYLPPQEAADFAESLSGEFTGIGAEIGMKKGQIMVIAPLDNTPAQRAGLRPGDAVISINDEDTFGMNVNTAVEKIRGEAGTEVKLVIYREGQQEPKEFKIKREKINVPSVRLTMREDNLAYIRVMQFNADTTSQMDRAIKDLKKKNASGIILDLRSNPGGYLDAAIEMGSEWVKEGVIVSERSTGGQKRDHRSSGVHRLAGIPTVVLVNGGSASASEIVAGALKDHKLAMIVGEQTYGKGSVQDFELFPDGSALKITIAEWLTPNGQNINDQGIAPDVEVKEDYANEAVGEDVVVDKAVEILKK